MSDSELQQGRKISKFPGASVFQPGTALTFIAEGVNYKIPLADFLSSLNVSGVIESVGDGVPVYQSAGSVNQIRAIDALRGLYAEQGTSQNVEISDGHTTTLTSSTTFPVVNSSEIIFCTVSSTVYDITLNPGAVTGDLVRVFSTASTATVSVKTTNATNIIYRGAVVTGTTGFVMANLRSVTLRKAPNIWIQESYDPA